MVAGRLGGLHIRIRTSATGFLRIPAHAVVLVDAAGRGVLVLVSATSYLVEVEWSLAMCLRPVRNGHLSGVHFTSHAAGADGRSTVLSWIDRPGSPALGQIGCGHRRCCAALSSVARGIPRILAGQPGDSVSERGKAAERETPVVYVLGIGVSTLVSGSLRPPRRRPAPCSERDSNGPRGLGARHGDRVRTDPIACRRAGGRWRAPVRLISGPRTLVERPVDGPRAAVCNRPRASPRFLVTSNCPDSSPRA